MSFSLMSVAIVIIFITVSVIEVYYGMKKGLGMSLVSFGATVTALLLSVLVTPLISLVIALLSQGILSNITVLKSFTDMFPSGNSVLIAVLTMAISVVLFIIVFFAFRAIIRLVFKIIFKVRTKRKIDDPGYRREDNSHSELSNKSAGGVVGFLSAVIVTMVLTCPIMGILDVADRAIGVSEQMLSTATSMIGEETVGTVRKFADDIPGNVFYQMGGKFIFNSVASAMLDGERIYLLNEVEVIEDSIDDFLSVYNIMKNPQNIPENQSEIINNLCENLENLKLCRPLLSDILREGSSAWLDHNEYMTIPRPSMNQVVDPALDEILIVCKNTSVKSVRYNIKTLLQIYSIVLESGITEMTHMDYSGIMNCLQDGGLLDRLNDVLLENPYMSGIDVSSIAMSTVSTHLNRVINNQQRYDALMDDIAYAINSVNNRGYGSLEEKIDVLADYAQGYFDDLGSVDVPEAITQEVAKELLQSLGNSGNDVTAADIADIFAKFAQ